MKETEWNTLRALDQRANCMDAVDNRIRQPALPGTIAEKQVCSDSDDSHGLDRLVSQERKLSVRG